ncbi:hypothetical protein [Dongia deserti]|uniref:hypothetical protein n=1 Tax=Dongia deserti TaxID=2268030 RepID=UPI000E656B6D|nr:hypothetical protein [Dongia deserti]
MRQALEIHGLPRRERLDAGWLGRLRIWLFGANKADDAIPLEARSPHLLRDIGLAEDVRSNHLLREHNFFRR